MEHEKSKEEKNLLEAGRRLKKLNFNKAPWEDIKAELRQQDWDPMKVLAKDSPIAAHTYLMDTLIPILEKLVAVKVLNQGKMNKPQK